MGCRPTSIPPTKSGNVGTVISNLELLWLKYDQLSAPKVDTLHVDEGKQKQIAWTDYTSIIISTEQRCARVVDANATQATGGGTRLDGLMGCSETEARLIAIAIVVVLIRVWKGEGAECGVGASNAGSGEGESECGVGGPFCGGRGDGGPNA